MQGRRIDGAAVRFASTVCVMIHPAVQTVLADSLMPAAQLMMFAGFILLGWVLVRRQLRMRRSNRRENRRAEAELRKIRQHREPALPLADAPPEIQRWQGAMFDLQRELSAELETRITTVQRLLSQVDELPTTDAHPASPSPVGSVANDDAAADRPHQRGRLADRDRRVIPPPISGQALVDFVAESLNTETPVERIAENAGVPIDEIRWTIAAMTPGGKVPHRPAVSIAG